MLSVSEVAMTTEIELKFYPINFANEFGDVFFFALKQFFYINRFR